MRTSSSRDDILDAADELFGRLGFDAASTREIALACDVNKALIHYHFKTKDELLGAVLGRYYGRLATTLALALSAEGDLEHRLGRLLDTYVDFLADNPHFSRIVQREASGGRHLPRIVAHMQPLFATAVDALQGALPALRSTPVEAGELFVSFYGMVVTWFTYADVLEALTGATPLSADALDRRKRHLRYMLHLVLADLATGRAEAPSPEPRGPGS